MVTFEYPETYALKGSVQSLGFGPHGGSLLLARKRTARSINEEVLLKCVALPEGKPPAAAQRLRARLEEEVRLAAWLRHSCIARAYGFEEG